MANHAKPGRDRLMLQVAYFGGLRVSELLLTWSRVSFAATAARRSLSTVGKGEKAREVVPHCRRGVSGRRPKTIVSSAQDAPITVYVFAGGFRDRNDACAYALHQWKPEPLPTANEATVGRGGACAVHGLRQAPRVSSTLRGSRRCTTRPS